MQKKEISFGLIHGSWHGAWCWDRFRYALAALGFDSVAVTLPMNDPDANFDDYADVAASALANENDLVLLAHSRSGNVAPRTAHKLKAVRHIIYCAASFEDCTTNALGHPEPNEAELMPQRNNDEFLDGIIPIEGGLCRLHPKVAQELFYHDCNPEVSAWAVSNLSPTRRSSDNPTMSIWPDVPNDYIVCTDDRVVNPLWQEYVASKWLNISGNRLGMGKIESGHSPFLSRPMGLAQTVVRLAC